MGRVARSWCGPGGRAEQTTAAGRRRRSDPSVALRPAGVLSLERAVSPDGARGRECPRTGGITR